MKYLQKTVSLAAAVAMGIASSSTLGQQKAQDPEPADTKDSGATAEIMYVYGTRNSYREDESSSVTRTSTALEDIPQSIFVITRDVIDDQAMNGLGDLVRYVPGVSMEQGEGHRDAPVFRGNISTSDFFVDGMRDDLQYIRDLYNVNRVDVIKGSSALVFGRGTGGGALNRVSKTANGETISSVDFGAGMYGYSRFAADFGGELSRDVAGRVNAVVEESDSFRDEVEISRRGIAPTVRIQATDATRIDLFAEVFSDERTVDRGVPSQDGQPWPGAVDTFFGNPDLSNSEIDVATLRGVATHAFGNGLTLRAALSYGDYGKFYENVYPGGAVDPLTESVRISSYNNATDRQNLLGQADLVWATSLAGLRHTLFFGLESGRQESQNRRVNSDSGIFSLDNRGRDLVPDFSVAPARDNTNDLDLFAVLVQDQIELSDQFKAVVGLRWDSFDLAFNDRRPGTADFGRKDNFVSPRVGLIWEPLDGLSFYGSWSEAFLPQSGEQFSSLNVTTAALEPEEFENLEIGARWIPNSRLLLSAALYQLDRTNTRAPGPIPETVVLTGSQRAEGLELALQGELMPGWNVIGAMSFQDAEITSTTSSAPSGRSAPLVPEFSASLWNRVSLTDRLDVGLGIIHQDQQFASISNAVVLPSYTRVDAALFYSLNERFDIQLNLENLADEEYWFTAHNDYNITPGSPVQARLKVSARF
ncbi:MAG: TonB-dependent siderophore receptor [Gammaproteobacteria bacterium]|nr:TonB-dependent siderophore receptor [Pseudomonadales bacterium]MCP5349270.1 TonB-dependent siderophore receptor [Pseudomonadales bacterium]